MGSTSGKRGPSRRNPVQQYTFDDSDATAWLMAFIVGAALSGAAVRVGLTRDGGAVALGIYHGEEYGVEYVQPGEPLANAVREISMVWGIPCAVWDDTAGRWILRP